MYDYEDSDVRNKCDDELATMVAKALEQTMLAEVIESQSSVGQLHFMLRVDEKNVKDILDQVCFPLLDVAEGNFDLFVGTQYFYDKLRRKRYGWVISFGSDDLKNTANIACEVINRCIPKFTVTEAPLLGPSAPAGSLSGGKKGASPLTA